MLSRCISDALKRHLARLRKLHGETARAQIMPELLPKKQPNVGLIIDHENK